MSPEWKALAPAGSETFSLFLTREGSSVTVCTSFDEFFHVTDSPALIVTSRGENWWDEVISTVRPFLLSSPYMPLWSLPLWPHAPIIAIRATSAARAPRGRWDFAMSFSFQRDATCSPKGGAVCRAAVEGIVTTAGAAVRSSL